MTEPPSLARLFAPKTIAVVGASAQPHKAGYQLLAALLPFEGKIFPVNPRGGTILGLPSYPSLAAIGKSVDFIALAVPQVQAPRVLEEAVAIGAGAALIVSGGFGETGPDGAKLQDEIVAICRAGGIRLLGPNTSGFIVPQRKLFATFLPTVAAIKPGAIGIVAQSGGINVTLAFMAHDQGLGISYAVGMGNAAEVKISEVIAHIANDSATKVLIMHIEGQPDGRRLFETVRGITERVPVVALPVGRADLGAFAQSHTGNLIGDNRLARAALHQAGAVIVDSLTDAIDAAYALSHKRLAPKARPGIGILTGQAGPGLLMTDCLKTAGIELPELGSATVRKIEGLLPPLTYMRNPVDTGRPSESFGAVLDAVVNDPAIDAVITFSLYEPAGMDPVKQVGDVFRKTQKPILFGTGGTPVSIAPVVEPLRALGLPCFTVPDRMARAGAALALDAIARFRIGGARSMPSHARGSLPIGPIDEHRAKAFVETFGIATPKRAVCMSHADALTAFERLGPRVVAKVLDPAILHKTEVGGVQLGIASSDSMARALDRIDAIPGRTPARRYLIETEAPPGIELILGALNDASYGACVVVGLGGIAAEAMLDVAMRLAPLDAADAEEMLDSLRGRALLGGFRGAAPPDRAKLVAAIVALGQLIVAHPEIKELDLNPVRANAGGVIALDAVILR